MSSWCPESMQWLMEKKKYSQVKVILKAISAANGGNFHENDLHISDADSEQHTGQWDELKEYLKTPKLLMYICIVLYIR